MARGLGSVEGSLEHAMVLADVRSLPVTLRKKWYSRKLLKVFWRHCVWNSSCFYLLLSNEHSLMILFLMSEEFLSSDPKDLQSWLILRANFLINNSKRVYRIALGEEHNTRACCLDLYVVVTLRGPHYTNIKEFVLSLLSVIMGLWKFSLF